MQLTNKKLIKSYKAILTSSLSAKSILESEAQKVDDKYKALAEQEKKDISEQLKTLDAQIEMCNKFIGEPECPVESEDTAEAEAETVSEEPEKVVDTLFPDNNTIDEEPTEQEEDSKKEFEAQEWPEDIAGEDKDAEDTSELGDESAVEDVETEVAEDIDAGDNWPETISEW